MLNGPEISSFISGGIPGVSLLYYDTVFSWANKALTSLNKNEPFLGFSILARLTIGKKANWGRWGTRS